jgi:ABC-2 type transport system ATP-binding protein
VVGANGAGKSTLFKVLLGLLPPTTGEVVVCGVPVADDPYAVRSRVGYMPEHECLPLDQSAADAVAFLGELSGLTARTARQRASDVLDLVGLDEARFRPVGGYSTGMKQRTKLAQALVAGPELVLLDEPTAGLDPGGRDEMLALVASLAPLGMSVLMATHLLDDVATVCDHVIVIDGGRLSLDSAVSDLQQLSGRLLVDVGPVGAPALQAALRQRGLEVTALEDGSLEVVEVPGAHDLVRDQVAALSLPLHRLSNRRGSLDEVFL